MDKFSTEWLDAKPVGHVLSLPGCVRSNLADAETFVGYFRKESNGRWIRLADGSSFTSIFLGGIDFEELQPLETLAFLTEEIDD